MQGDILLVGEQTKEDLGKKIENDLNDSSTFQLQILKIEEKEEKIKEEIECIISNEEDERGSVKSIQKFIDDFGF